MSIVDDVNTMSVAAESNAYLLKQHVAGESHAAQDVTPSTPPPTGFNARISLTQLEDLVKSVRDVEKTVWINDILGFDNKQYSIICSVSSYSSRSQTSNRLCEIRK